VPDCLLSKQNGELFSIVEAALRPFWAKFLVWRPDVQANYWCHVALQQKTKEKCQTKREWRDFCFLLQILIKETTNNQHKQTDSVD
jgi:hypothetical protein